MGDHRASIKITFAMHDVTTEGEFWVNWWRGAAADGLPDAVIDWFVEAERKSMEAYDDWQDAAEREANERRQKIIHSARQKLTDEEWRAMLVGLDETERVQLLAASLSHEDETSQEGQPQR